MLKVERTEEDRMLCRIECESVMDLIEQVTFLISYCKKSILDSDITDEDKENGLDFLRQGLFAGLDTDIDWENERV
ncbi:MAG: hypothetical protein ACTTKY_00360 [Catonella sp.]|jgi:hypothetical protein